MKTNKQTSFRLPTVNVVNKLEVTVGSLENICQNILRYKKKKRVILPCSLNDLTWVEKSRAINDAYKKIDMLLPDGMPLVWAIRLKGKKTDRIYGPTLMTELLRITQDSSHVFFGSSNETLQKLKQKLIKRYPKINITGTISPPYRALTGYEKERYRKQIYGYKPDFLWIGLNSPKQVVLAAKWKKKLPGTTILCIGAAFDILAGTIPQAPVWMRNAGLEWLFRLYSEPRRLWKRYLIDIPAFLMSSLLSSVFKPRRKSLF